MNKYLKAVRSMALETQDRYLKLEAVAEKSRELADEMESLGFHAVANSQRKLADDCMWEAAHLRAALI